MKKCYVADQTLQVLCEEQKIPLLFREKTALAAAIDAFGADAVELPQIRKVKEDTVIYRTIASVVKKSRLCLPAGTDAEEIAQAWECVKNAQQPCLQIVLPVSTVQMEYLYHAKESKMQKKIEELCSTAAAFCSCVEFVALDASRADETFLIAACEAAQNSGAKAVTICDTAGIWLPEDVKNTVTVLKEKLSCALYVQTSDQISMSMANALAALTAGADGIKAAAAGKNVLRIDAFADTAAVKGEYLGIEAALDRTQIHTDIRSMLKNLRHEDKVLEAADENADVKEVFLDRDSTLSEISEASKKLGYALSDEDNGKVFDAVMRVCEKRDALGAKEFEAIIASAAMQAPSTYHLESFLSTSSNITASMAHVTLLRTGEILHGVASGDGPIDAAFKAIEQCIGYHYELDDFQIQSVTEGQEALGSALVKLRSQGRLYSGNGISSDIVGASIRAYINALNKIVFEEVE